MEGAIDNLYSLSSPQSFWAADIVELHENLIGDIACFTNDSELVSWFDIVAAARIVFSEYSIFEEYG